MTQVCPITIPKEVAQNQLMPTGINLIRKPETWQNQKLFTWKRETDCILPLQGQIQKIQDNDGMEDKM